ncbi:MAG: hypothetical protein A2Y23_01520 [Clostridiales bacterium GWB2_37_7]|nr:MAG: hypothetical protein A2Y23_01520 [Clostridiales bacterium GWB2_37_7]
MKHRKTLSIIITSIIFIVGISGMVLYKLGDKVFDEIVDQQISEIEKIVETAENNDAATESSMQTEIQISNQQSGKATSTTQIPAIKQAGSTQIPAIEPTDSTQIPAEKPIAAVSDLTKKQAIATNQDMQITKDKLEDIKESVSASDKMTAAALVISKLSQSDINYLTELSAGGITPEEEEEMKAIVYSKFTEDEIQKIKETYIKYMK